MTNDKSGDDFQGNITSEEAFEARLSELIVTARQNGIDPLGSWVFRNGKTAPDMEVMIFELADQGE
ncbi:MAG: hypothetical protein V5A34_05795 [Halapricum sp.]